MPYIPHDQRADAEFRPVTPGHLNFAITRLMIDYLYRRPQPCYTDLNDCLGALEGAKLEFYRRVVVPFEEDKKATNGDVYPGGAPASFKKLSQRD
jgi:hypothetical protein